VDEAVFNRVRLAEIAAVVTFTLMRRVDEWISPVASGLLDNKTGFNLICEYRRSLGNAKAATALAVELLRSVCRPTYDRERCEREIEYFASKGHWRGELSTAYLCEEAEHRGIPVTPQTIGPVLLGQGHLQKRLRETLTSGTGILSMRMAQDKMQTASILRQAGVPVPEQISVENKADAIEAAKRIGYPVVVKPFDGSQGEGVSVKLMSEDAVAAAFKEARKSASRVIVESYIAGYDHRLLVVNGEFVASCQRVPGHVVGNGTDTVERLLEILNSDPRRNGDLMYQLKFDFDARRMLEEQGLTLESVPEAGQVVVLRSKGNTSVGGTSKGITEQVHPDNRRLAVAAARALQLDIAGIDLITTDITRSYKETRGAVCEVNSRPGILDLHVFPLEGSSVAVGPYVMDMLFPPPSVGRIPVIAVHGDTFDNAHLSHSIAHILQMAGHEVALATHAGLWIGGDRIGTTDCANFAGTQKAVLHPAATAAVVEITTDSLLSEGLGVDFANVAVIAQNVASAAAGLIQSTAGSLIRASDAAVPESDSERKKIRLVNSENAMAGQLAAAACRAVGVSQDVIDDALKASRDGDVSDALILRGLATPAGRVLLGTPRNSREVAGLLKAARSWAAPHAPDVIIHMSFESDPDLQAALERELKSGTARVLDRDLTTDLRADITPLVFTGDKRKVVILTDGMDYFRKRLEHVSAPSFPHASFAGRPRTC
jgi:cyanophycin synthetase